MSKFKSIKFVNSQRKKENEPMRDKNTIAYIKNILVNINNNCYLFKYTVDYTWIKFLQASKSLKLLMNMFFSNLDLAYMQEYIKYQNLDKMQALLIELSYGKIT